MEKFPPPDAEVNAVAVNSRTEHVPAAMSGPAVSGPLKTRLVVEYGVFLDAMPFNPAVPFPAVPGEQPERPRETS